MSHDHPANLFQGFGPAFFQEALDASPVPMIILERREAALHVIYVNRSFERGTGYPAARILDGDLRTLCGGEPDGEVLSKLASDSSEAIEIPLTGIRRDGSRFRSELTLAPLGREGAALRYVGLLRDVTAELAEREELTQFALQDELTGLPNRRALERHLAKSIAGAQAERRAFPVLLLDLDGFKGVNDEFGHAAGDQLLRVISARLRHELRVNDMVSRIGGDEFVVVLESARDRSQLADIRDRIATRLTAPVAIEGTTVRVGCSIGESWFPLHGADSRSLLQRADRRMYEEKRRHHERVDGFFAMLTREAFAPQRAAS